MSITMHSPRPDLHMTGCSFWPWHSSLLISLRRLLWRVHGILHGSQEEFGSNRAEMIAISARLTNGAHPSAEIWLLHVQVDFRNVQMRYRDGLPLVLRGLSVTVSPGSRCGVVGRTGAGKSSLINCLFRLQELCGGSIVIDGVDIAKMGLKDLRSNMAIIPQVCNCLFL